MASFVSQDVAAEKVDAMRRFERTRYFWKFLPVIEALVVVLLLLSWLTPSLSVGEYLQRILSGGWTGGVFIFVIVNVLIALIFSLSNHHQKVTEPDLYFQYVSSSATTNTLSENEEKTSGEKSGTDLSSVTLTAEEARPVRREMVRAVSSVAETAHAIRRKNEMTFLPPVATESSSDHQVYRRSRSERLDVRGEFRRSMRRLCDMDDLSSDEFRSTVETFIAGKKKMLLKEWMKP
ncbi:BnaA09g27820D [Brassica napus]|uniref:BnaA09g27820D protein n=1 Tax=Brassica napus TaxID=3708 RepID=A0A078GM43_BRANA|nr:BnaA09g27820D [Brassica napus]